jgi:hypothetical protein
MKTLKTKLLVFVTILMLGMTAAAPAFSADELAKVFAQHPVGLFINGPGAALEIAAEQLRQHAISDDWHELRWQCPGPECRNEAISDNTDGINDNTDGINDNAARIEQVNKEDMRVKSGTVNGNTLTLRVKDMAKTQGRSEIYDKNVDIDVSSLRGNDGVDGNDGFGTQADLDRVETRIEQVNQEDHRAVGGSLNNGTLTINTEDMDGGSKRTFTVDGDFNAESKANQLDIETNRSRIEQVNHEDQRLKDGEVNANGDLVLYTEDQPDGQSRRAVTVDGFKTNVTDKIAENEGRLDDNDVTNSRQDNAIGNNAQGVADNADMNDAQNKDLRDHNGRISGNDRDIAENEGRLDDNDATNRRQNYNIGNNAQGVADNADMDDRQNNVIRDNVARHNANDDLNDRQNNAIRGNAQGVAANSDRLDQNDVLDDRQTGAILDNRDRSVANANMNNAQNTVLRDHNGRLDANDQLNDRQNNAIRGNAEGVAENAQGVADNESMNNAQNKVLRDHNGRIGANTTAISNVHGYTVDNRRDIDLNAYGIETNRRAIVDTNARIDGVMNDMRYLDRNLSAGIASAVAMGQHNFDPTYQGGQVSIAGGHFNGANAVSLAVGVPAGSNAFFSLSAAANDGPGNESIGMGLTYRLP